jgi:hypothetical protein
MSKQEEATIKHGDRIDAAARDPRPLATTNKRFPLVSFRSCGAAAEEEREANPALTWQRKKNVQVQCTHTRTGTDATCRQRSRQVCTTAVPVFPT